MLAYGKYFLVVFIAGGLTLASVADAAPPWTSLIPFKAAVEADPNKPYVLTEEQGPWMILASSFAGTGAQQQAHDLVIELRQRFNWEAYVHKQVYDYTQPVIGIGVNRQGTGGKRMRYQHAAKFDQWAVLVGNFDSVDAPRLQKVLNKMKYAQPQTLDLKSGRRTSQRMAILREMQRRISPDPEKKQRGPMGSAFATPNPLVPREYLTGSGVDSLVLKMNQDVTYSLLKNPHPFTVQIASFRGKSTMNLREIEIAQRKKRASNKLAEAAVKANKLTMALRARNVEAYEYHDREKSIVTVGGFTSLGKELPNGAVEINPAIYRVIQAFRAEQQQLPGQPTMGVVPKQIEGISLDVQPLPIDVPKASIGAAYARRN